MRPRGRQVNGPRGFTLVELLVVFAIVALGITLVSLALPDSEANKLEEEAARLASLLESARAEARVAGVVVHWIPRPLSPDGVLPPASAAQFQFVGLPARVQMPTRFLDPRTKAQVVGASQLVLGPDAILPGQRLVLRLGQQRLELHSDGLGPFTEPVAGGAVGAASGPSS